MRKTKNWCFVLLSAAILTLLSCTSLAKKYEQNWFTDETQTFSSTQIQSLEKIRNTLLQEKEIILWIVVKDTVSKHFLLPELHRFFWDWRPNVRQQIAWYDRYIFFKSEKDKTLLLYIQKQPTVFYPILGRDLKDSEFESKIYQLTLDFNENKDASNGAILKLVETTSKIEFKKPSWLLSNFLADTFRETWDFRHFGAYLFDVYLVIINSMVVFLGSLDLSLILAILLFTFLFSATAVIFESIENKPKTSSDALSDLGNEIGFRLGIIVAAVILKNPGVITFALVTSKLTFFASAILMPIVCLVDIVLTDNAAGLLTIKTTSHIFKSNFLEAVYSNKFAELFSNRFIGIESLLIILLFLLHFLIVISYLFRKVSDKGKIKVFLSVEAFSFVFYLLLFYVPTRFLPVSFSLAYAIPVIFHLYRSKSFVEISKSVLSVYETRHLIRYSQRALLLCLIPIFIAFFIFSKT